jgi:phosphatidylglycerophosphate synthase
MLYFASGKRSAYNSPSLIYPHTPDNLSLATHGFQYNMTIYALLPELSPVRLWGLDAGQRLRRQLSEISKESSKEFADIHWLDGTDDLPHDAKVLIFNGHFLFENRTIKGVMAHPDTVLLYERQLAAAFVDGHKLTDVVQAMRDPGYELSGDLNSITTLDLEAFDINLRRSTIPLLEPVSSQRKDELENELYGNAYRGITDLVTKFVWPRPAKRAVHVSASLGLTPNMITSIGLLLVIAACFLFYEQLYAWGLLAGWVMTFLDTVDGKLARVTIKSSKFGHLYDHMIDLIHPPFWYIIWGQSLLGFNGVMGLSVEQMGWIIILAYISGRIVELLFQLLGSCGIFTWRPFDAWFRLITARRNPCMILLTLSVFAGRPDWGFIAVTFWTLLTTLIMNLRLLYAFIIRVKNGPLSSWLSEDDVATGQNAYSYSIFGATRVVYEKK